MIEVEHIRPGETVAQAAERNMNEFRLYIEALVHSHRQAGGGPSPFINRLVNARVNGELMNDQQLIGYLFQLLGAGNDTTRNTLAGGVKALLEHPAELARLCAQPDLIASACDEMLRWTSPVLSLLRTATRDFELSGTLIRAGDTVGIFYPSANRDERVFRDPFASTSGARLTIT